VTLIGEARCCLLCANRCDFVACVLRCLRAALPAVLSTDRLYSWNYVTDFGDLLNPFPNYYTMGCGKRPFLSHLHENDYFTKTGSGQK
jgi:hypothetical protein